MRVIQAEDLYQLQTVNDPQISPDGQQVLYVQQRVDRKTEKKFTNLWLVPGDGGTPRQFTFGDQRDSMPRWSPDGKLLAYLAAVPAGDAPPGPPPAVTVVDRGAQLHILDVESGGVYVMTRLRGGVMAPEWSPDGTQIAFVTYVDPALGLETLTDAPPADDAYTKFSRDVLVTSRVRWKFDNIGHLGEYRRQIATLAIDPATLAAPAAPILRTQEKADLAPPAWSPDGRTLATAGNLDDDGELVRSSKVYLVDLTVPAPVTPRPLFRLEEMRSSDLAWSPDGHTLAVCGHNDPVIGHYGNQYLWLVDVSTGEGTNATAWLDRALGDYSRNSDMRRYGGDDGPRWIDGGKRLLVLVNEGGSVFLAEIDPAAQTMTPLTSGRQSVIAFTVDRSEVAAVLLIADDMNPGDLYRLKIERGLSGLGGSERISEEKIRSDPLNPPDPRSIQRLTRINAELFDELEMTEPIRFWAQSGDVQIDSWLIPPVGAEPGKRYPVILYTGGGPGGMRASVFCHEFHLYAAQGYAVLHCNTRGNHGYGQDFSTPTRGAWGDLDTLDNMASLRAACAQFDFIDPERTAVAGGSYGGYMATWIISRYPEFKAAVVDRCLFNRHSFNGVGDIGFLLDRVEFDKQLPWENPQRYLERSPMSGIAGVKTPTLVVHSAEDLRCPVDQGEQLYMALHRVGVPTKLVRFPNESHELSRSGRPWHRIFRLEQYLAWFEEWL
ncbi:MAG: S9 family peptidase [Caldilineaceae bacterium]